MDIELCYPDLNIAVRYSGLSLSALGRIIGIDNFMTPNNPSSERNLRVCIALILRLIYMHYANYIACAKS